MLIKVQHTELVAASPEQLFTVLTNYADYPRSLMLMSSRLPSSAATTTPLK